KQIDEILDAVYFVKSIHVRLEPCEIEPSAAHPPRDLVMQPLEHKVRSVFVQQPVLQDLELQSAHGAHDRVAHPSAAGVQDLDGALLRQLLEPFLELLALESVLCPHPREDLRGKPRQLGVL